MASRTMRASRAQSAWLCSTSRSSPAAYWMKSSASSRAAGRDSTMNSASSSVFRVIDSETERGGSRRAPTPRACSRRRAELRPCRRGAGARAPGPARRRRSGRTRRAGADRLGLDHLAADLSCQLRKNGDVLGVRLGVLQHASHEVPPQSQARLRVHGAEHRGDALLELVLVGLVLEVEPQPLPRDGQQELRVVRGARPGEEHCHAARLLLLDAAEVDAPEQRAEPVDVAARVEGEGPAHGGLERHPGAGVGAAGRAAAEARHQALPRLLRCPAAVHKPATGGEAAPLHAGDERLLDQLLVAGELPEEPPVHPLGRGLVAGGERDPPHDPGARGEARMIGEPGGFGLVARRAIRGARPRAPRRGPARWRGPRRRGTPRRPRRRRASRGPPGGRARSTDRTRRRCGRSRRARRPPRPRRPRRASCGTGGCRRRACRARAPRRRRPGTRSTPPPSRGVARPWGSRRGRPGSARGRAGRTRPSRSAGRTPPGTARRRGTRG